MNSTSLTYSKNMNIEQLLIAFQDTVNTFQKNHKELEHNAFLEALKQNTIELIMCHLFGRLAVIHLYDIPCSDLYISTYFIEFIQLCLQYEIYPSILRDFSRVLSVVSLHQVCNEDNDYSIRMFIEQTISIFMHVYQDCYNFIEEKKCKRKNKDVYTVVEVEGVTNVSRYFILKALQKNLPMTPLINCLAISVADVSDSPPLDERVKNELGFLCRLILFTNCHYYNEVPCFKEGCDNEIYNIIKQYPVPFLKNILTFYFPIVPVDSENIVYLIPKAPYLFQSK